MCVRARARTCLDIECEIFLSVKGKIQKTEEERKKERKGRGGTSDIGIIAPPSDC